MADDQIHALLKKTLGLHLESIGLNSVERAVRRRIKVLSLADKEAYLAWLKTAPEELKELVEEVVVPETWFFRDQKPFETMAAYVLGPWTARHRDQTLRLLSVPCSSGEEPYSLAMALLMMGWPRNKFQIEAIDISKRSLTRAQEGLYTENSFRDDALAFRNRYFTMTEKKYLISPLVRQKVRFHHGNLLDPDFMTRMGIFDIVFCRNVLIYLDKEAQERAISNLDLVVANDGLLFTGHAEANLFLDSLFRPAPQIQSFAFVKKNPGLPASSAAATSVSTPAPQASPLPSSRDEGNFLDRAQTAADRGDLGLALELCQKHIHQCTPTAGAFFLLGVIQHAIGEDSNAFSSLRKTVYLEPDHEEALLLLSLLAEKLGDSDKAEVYRQRAKRCQHDKETSQ